MTDKTVKLAYNGGAQEIEVAAVVDDIVIHRPFTVRLDTGVISYEVKEWTASHIPTGTKLHSLLPKKPTLAELKRWGRLVQDEAPAAWALMSTFEFGKVKLVGDERVVGTMIIEASRKAWAEVRGD